MSPQPPTPNSDIVLRAPDARQALEWMTALSAAGHPFRAEFAGNDWLIRVDERHADAAWREIREFEAVNRNWPPAAPAAADLPISPDILATVGCAALFLVAVYLRFGPFNARIPILLAAAADSSAIVAGEWWRCVTALCLHSGLGHLVGNGFGLLLAGAYVCAGYGRGLGLLLILAAGAAGNFTVAMLERQPHLSVGASTAVFGAIGILVGGQFMRKLRHHGSLASVWSRAWVPLCAGVALLGMIGSGGPNVDLGAHFFGLLYGIVLALPATPSPARARRTGLQSALVVVSILLVFAAWTCVVLSVS